MGFAEARPIDVETSSLVSDLLLYYWGEPERAPHRRDKRSQSIYYVICMVRPSREIIYPVISTGINAKYSIAHSHAWDTGRIYVVLI